MKNNKIVFLIFNCLILFSCPIFSQNAIVTNKDEVSDMVINEMDEVFRSADFLKKKSKKFSEVSGTIVVDIGVIQNGKVSTFFKVDSDIDNPMFTNFLSEYIIDYKFKFKLQKQEHYKIRYTIQF